MASRTEGAKMGLFQFLWRLLPDRCQMPHCTRRGVRGNENRIVISGRMRTICDECTVIELQRRRGRSEYTDMHKRVIDALNEGEL